MEKLAAMVRAAQHFQTVDTPFKYLHRQYLTTMMFFSNSGVGLWEAGTSNIFLTCVFE